MALEIVMEVGLQVGLERQCELKKPREPQPKWLQSGEDRAGREASLLVS